MRAGPRTADDAVVETASLDPFTVVPASGKIAVGILRLLQDLSPRRASYSQQGNDLSWAMQECTVTSSGRIRC